MIDYINREDTIKTIESETYRHDYLDHVIDIIEAIPSADVAPVSHGRWIEKAFRIMCSDCGAEFKDEILYMIGNDEQMNYCPNCGAKMDGEDDEIDRR